MSKEAVPAQVIAALRVLVISNCPLAPNQGSGYIICGYAQGLRGRGHRVDTWGTEDFTWWPQLQRAVRLRRLLGYAATALRHARAEHYDIVELWGAEGWLAWLLLRLPGRRRPVVVSRSNGLETHWWHLGGRAGAAGTHWLAPLLDRLPETVFRGAEALTLVSHNDARYARQRGYQAADRLLVIENPLRAEWLGQAIVWRREPVVGFVGAWLDNKGAKLLVPAMQAVWASRPEARFILVGIGEGGRAAVRMALGDDVRIELVTQCTRADLRTLYHRMALLWMPSGFESFGLVAAEGMSCGAALVATRTGLAADLNADSFFALQERTAAALAAATVRALADEPRRQAVAQGGWRRVQSLDWAPAVQGLEALYLRLLGRSPSPAS